VRGLFVFFVFRVFFHIVFYCGGVGCWRGGRITKSSSVKAGWPEYQPRGIACGGEKAVPSPKFSFILKMAGKMGATREIRTPATLEFDSQYPKKPKTNFFFFFVFLL